MHVLQKLLRIFSVGSLLWFHSPSLAATAFLEVLQSPEVGSTVNLQAMSHDGSTGYGYLSGENFSQTPFRWTRSVGIEVVDDVLPGLPRDVSSDGSVVVGTASARLTVFNENGLYEEPFLWEQGIGLSFPDGPDPLFFLTKIHGGAAVSGDGTTVLINRNNQDIFRWDTRSDTVSPTGLTESAGQGSLPSGSGLGTVGIGYALGSNKSLTHDGHIIVGTTDLAGGGFAAARVVGDGDPVVIGPEGSSALLVTPDGSHTVGSHPDGMFIWTEQAGYTDLGGIGSPLTVPTGLTDDGELIVGYYRNEDRDTRFFVWTADLGFVDTAEYFSAVHQLDLFQAGSPVRSLVSVSGDGKVFAGRGFDPAIGTVSYLVTVVPEPTASLMSMFAVLLVSSWPGFRKCTL